MSILYSACYCNNVPAPPVSSPLPPPLCLSSPLPVQLWGLRSGPAGVCCCLQYWGSLLQYCCIDGVWSVSVAAENRFKVLGNHHNGFDFNKLKGKGSSQPSKWMLPIWSRKMFHLTKRLVLGTLQYFLLNRLVLKCDSVCPYNGIKVDVTLFKSRTLPELQRNLRAAF